MSKSCRTCRNVGVDWSTVPNGKSGYISKWKRHLGESCPHGKEIFLVNGSYVRNHFDSDFIAGGNGYRYRWIPRGELWLDDSSPAAEWPYNAFHECHESEDMKHGASYEKAHDAAKRIEDRMRHRDHPGEPRSTKGQRKG